MNNNKNKKIDAKLGTPERFGYAWNIASKITKINEIQFLNWTKVIKNKKFWSGKKNFGCGLWNWKKYILAHELWSKIC